MTFGGHLWSAIILQAILDGNHYQKSQNDSHRFNIETCKQKPNTTKFGLIFNFNMLSAILDGNHYQKSQKWLPSHTDST